MSTLAHAILPPGLYSERPIDNSLLTAGRLYLATDTRQILRDNGTTWDPVDLDTVPYCFAWEYADEAERLAATGFTGADLYKLAIQISDNSVWLLDSVTPSWTAVGSQNTGGHILQDNGVPLAQRTNLNFVGATLTDDSINDATVVTITGGGSGTLSGPDAPPDSPNVLNDEFDDESINAAWSVVSHDSAFNLFQTTDTPVHVSEALHPGFLMIQGTLLDANGFLISKPFTPTLTQPWTLACKLSPGGFTKGVEKWIALKVLGQSTSHRYEARIGINWNQTMVRTISNNGSTEIESNVTNTGFCINGLYVLITHDGNKNFSTFISPDGLAWSCVDMNRNLSNINAFTRFGFSTTTYSTAPGIHAVDFIRYFPVAGQFMIGKPTAVGGGSGGGHTIKSASATLPPRTNLKFVGAEVTDDSPNNTTVVTVSGGSLPNVQVCNYWVPLNSPLTTVSEVYTTIDGTNLRTRIRKSAGTSLVVNLLVSFYSTVGNTEVEFGINDGTTDYTVVRHYINNGALHAQIGGILRIDGLVDGTYTLTLRWRRASGTGTLTMGADHCSISVTEVIPEVQ